MTSPSCSATAENIQTFQGSVIPALNLARAGVTGIGVPGIEGAVNAIFELAKMVSTMKGNKKDLAALKKSVDALAVLKVPGATGDLQERLTELSLKMTVRSDECIAHGGKSPMDRFLRSDEYSRKIMAIRNGVADDIREFTLHGNISIEMLVKDMAQKVDQVLTTNILAKRTVDQVLADNILGRLKYSAARYNADNTPRKCMDGTRIDIIKEILGKLTASPGVGQRLVI
ncbi:hypothetical protein B0H11DRAFT_2190093, partial [Mycena galericulata]